MQTDADHRPQLDDPTTWHTAQLEWIDSQLANQVHSRARHMTDVQLYARVQAHLPMQYHQAQAERCSTRIAELLDLRLRIMRKGEQG